MAKFKKGDEVRIKKSGGDGSGHLLCVGDVCKIKNINREGARITLTGCNCEDVLVYAREIEHVSEVTEESLQAQVEEAEAEVKDAERAKDVAEKRLAAFKELSKELKDDEEVDPAQLDCFMAVEAMEDEKMSKADKAKLLAELIKRG